jgi:hypothetical protein
MSNFKREMKQMAMWIDDGCVLIETDGEFVGIGDYISDTIRVPLDQIPLLIQWLEEAARELKQQEQAAAEK